MIREISYYISIYLLCIDLTIYKDTINENIVYYEYLDLSCVFHEILFLTLQNILFNFFSCFVWHVCCSLPKKKKKNLLFLLFIQLSHQLEITLNSTNWMNSKHLLSSLLLCGRVPSSTIFLPSLFYFSIPEMTFFFFKSIPFF